MAQRMLDYWTALRGAGQVPTRFEVNPAAIADILGNTFVAEAEAMMVTKVRIMGRHATTLVAGYKTPLPEPPSEMMRHLFAGDGITFGVFGLEYVYLPLELFPGGEVQRIIGTIVAVSDEVEARVVTPPRRHRRFAVIQGGVQP